MKKTTKLVLMSVLTIAMCVSLIAGATFALFTSESSVNIAVSSGKVEVMATLGDYSLYTNLYNEVTDMDGDTWTNGGKVAMSGDTITLDKMTPGDGVKFDINIDNNSNVAIQYRLTISVEKDGGLLSGLEVTINGEKFTDADITLSSSFKHVDPMAEIAPINVTMELPESAGNEYQDLTCDLLVSVEAVQGNAKPNELIKVDEKHYIANNAGSLIAFANALRNGEIKSSEGNGAAILTITRDIDLDGYVWVPMVGAHIVIDGGNHTISNVNCSTTAGKSAFLVGYGATIKNLTLNNVTAKGAQAAAFIANNQGGGNLINCALKGNVSITYQADATEEYGAVGAFIAAYDGTKLDNLSVEANTAITIISAGMSDSKLADKATDENLLLGYYYTASAPAYQPSVDGSATITVVDSDYIVDSKGNWHIYTAQGLVALQEYFDSIPSNDAAKGMPNKVITLEESVDMTGIEWKPIGLANAQSFKAVFDGKNNKISNLTINVDSSMGTVSKGKYTGFIALVDSASAEIKDVVFENATVNSELQMVGVVAGRFGSATSPKMTNVTLTGKIEVTGTSYVGAVVGHAGGIMEGITVNADKGSFVKGVQIGGLAGATRTGNGSYTDISINIDVEGRYVGGIVGWEQGSNVYTNCSYTGTLTSTTAAEPVNTCFGAVLYAGTTVDGFTFNGKIVGGTYTGFYFNNGEDATFTNSSATLID